MWIFHYKEASENKLFVIFPINWYQQNILFMFLEHRGCNRFIYEAHKWPEP